MNKQGTKNLYFSFAGFKLKIVFFKTFNPVLQDETLLFYKNIYRGFITDGIPKKTDYRIRFFDFVNLHSFINKDNSRYIRLYEDKNKCIDTYYYISLKQF